jgi:CBS domain-containing protein
VDPPVLLGDGDKAAGPEEGRHLPLVHGVRSLASEARLACTGTVERIEALRAMGPAAARRGRGDLVDSLHFLMGLKLQAGLDASTARRATAAWSTSSRSAACSATC